MKALTPVALARLGKATATTVIMGLLCAAFFPLGPVVLIPFLVLPLAHLVARWGLAYGLILAVVASALEFVAAGTGMATLVFLILLGVGIPLGEALRKGWKFEATLASTVSGALVALCFWGMTLWLLLGRDLTWFREAADSSITEAAALYARMGVSLQTTDTVSAQLRQIAHVVPYLAPGLVGMGAVLLAVCSLGLAHLLFPRVREKVAVGLSLSGFRMHWAAAYASIAGLAMLVFARGDAGWHSVVLYVGLNMLMVSQTLFFVQGLAVARWFATTRQLRPGSRTALYIGAILGQVLFQLTGLVGLFDTWLDYRKRFVLKSPGTGSVR